MVGLCLTLSKLDLLIVVLTSLGEKLTDAEVDELLKLTEVDKNGYVNYENFVRSILSN
jgi:calmodulin